jgi:hypothetical protein
MMDFDWQKIPSLVNGIHHFANFSAEEITTISLCQELNGNIIQNSSDRFFEFKPTSGWQGHIEI